MTPIYCHEYTITSWEKKKMGIREIKITTVSESEQADAIEAVEAALKFFDQNLNITHKIVLTGYKDE